ncbi:MAG: ribosome rescue GTPase HflX [Gammaproteobacteria bacterium]
MFERPAEGEHAVLVAVDFRGNQEHDLGEFSELAASAGASIVEIMNIRRDVPDPRYFIGSGKVEELSKLVEQSAVDLVLFDHKLSPGQERNLENALKCRVIDRTRLILDIFAQRARSFEGKLQVELAQLEHQSTRLIRGWTHLERQKGGIGMRGPGETQLESDRRMIAQRIKQINARLERVRTQRHQSARARRRAYLSVASLVGYTNAGKSTLFNRLSSATAFAADQLFATLDTTLRRIDVPGEHPVLLSDTVGFIRDLPPELVAAFQATLEETKDATVLLHVIDASATERDEHILEVERTLNRIGAGDKPVIQVFNKIDRLDMTGAKIERDAAGRATAVWLSAKTGEGVNLLLDVIAEHLDRTKERFIVTLPPQFGRARAKLYEMGAVIDETITEQGGWALEITIAKGRWESLSRDLGVSNLEITPLDLNLEDLAEISGDLGTSETQQDV